MWTVEDRWGNEIVLTEECWQHISEGHWELADRLDQVLDTVRWGTRKQYPLDPGRFRYSQAWPDLPHDYTHIFVIVRLMPGKFIITAYPKRVR